MIYEYLCDGCGKSFDVVKPARDYDKEELCPTSAVTMARLFGAVYFSGTRVQEAEYNPGLGCIVKNKDHRAEICRQRGLEEIGNEKPESLHKHFDKRRQEMRDKAWSEADKGWVGDGT